MKGGVRRENGPAAFDADVEKDVGRAREDEISRKAEDPEDDDLRSDDDGCDGCALMRHAIHHSSNAHPVTGDQFLREIIDPERDA